MTPSPACISTLHARPHRFVTIVQLCLALLLFSTSLAATARMNVLLVMTDDQRFDGLPRMASVTDLANQGVRFDSALQTMPLCSPSRASLLSGGYLSQNTGVLENQGPNGGAQLFRDDENLGEVLQTAGYRTAFIGKWINGYEGMGPYVPPGWSRWVGRRSFANVTSWFNFRYVIGSSGPSSSLGTLVSSNQYTAYYERDQVLDFIDKTPVSQPFFVMWDPSAPHEDAVPAHEDENLYPTYVYRERGYGESDLGDKPRWVRSSPWPTGSDEFVRDQLRTLQSVDRSIGAIVDHLREAGRLDQTVVIFTSDNGHLWGEHRLWGKSKPYQEAVRVPLVVRMPGIGPRVETRLVSPSLDLGPTIYEIAGVRRPASDGRSLLPLLQNTVTDWRNDLFMESTAQGNFGNATWASVQTGQWHYVRYWTGEEELYDLVHDPYELSSRHRDASVATVKADLAQRAMSRRGLAIVPVPKFPAARVLTSYSRALQVWGGVGPFTWSLVAGALPPGLKLSSSSGLISGTPTRTGSYTFTVRLTDTALATQAQRPRTFVAKPFTIVVGS